jgi:hypothetical protein
MQLNQVECDDVLNLIGQGSRQISVSRTDIECVHDVARHHSQEARDSRSLSRMTSRFGEVQLLRVGRNCHVGRHVEVARVLLRTMGPWFVLGCDRCPIGIETPPTRHINGSMRRSNC